MSQSNTTSIFVWSPAGDSDGFQHPSDVPTDESTAKARWAQNKRGPRLARISPATLLQTKGTLALIAEKGATRELQKSMVLPWYEGLLLLDELENTTGQSGHLQASWVDKELTSTLEQERTKFKHLSGSLYTERRLVQTAVTGSSFYDKEDREWAYRRENVKGDDKAGLVDGEDNNGFYRVKEVLAYLPPWEAFCHEKCGFYQDFYLVRWEYPFSEVDYSKVENGCTTQIGATWEPDECLPAHLDHWRVAAKKAWIKKQREQEEKIKAQKAQNQGVKRPGASPPEAVKRIRSEDATPAKDGKEEEVNGDKPAVPKRKLKGDGTPLAPDDFLHHIGHDFVPESHDKLNGIRTGWPKSAKEYPKGYGVANPPGFCWEGCDCMDDQRPQRSWETTKAWLEDKTRSEQALQSIEMFSKQGHFVRRRGQVSKMCFFETAMEQLPDQTHARSALDLAGSIGRRIGEVLKAIPVQSLQGMPGPRAFIPAVAFLPEELDADPLTYKASMRGGAPLPPWLTVSKSNGELQVSKDFIMTKDEHFQIEFLHTEGVVGTASFIIAPRNPMGSTTPWLAATGNIIQRFSDQNVCRIDPACRAVLSERLAEIWDWKKAAPQNVSLGQWLRTVALILRMLRSTAVAAVTPGAQPK